MIETIGTVDQIRLVTVVTIVGTAAEMRRTTGNEVGRMAKTETATVSVTGSVSI